MHDPLVAETLFYAVQDILDGRKRNYRLKVASNATLPLRGFLLCPKCQRVLTGSASKGHSKYYSYYHCTDGCSSRFPAENVNGLFIQELKKYTPRPEVAGLFKALVMEAWQEQASHLQDDSKLLLSQVKELEGKLSYARDLLSSRQIEPDDYREMKADYTARIEKLEAKLTSNNYEKVDIKSLLDKGILNLLNIENLYTAADIEKKREVISSMYPEKMIFDGFNLRTA